MLLHREQVPILPDRLEQVVEKFIELLSQVIPDEQNVIPQVHFVLAQCGTDRLVEDGLPVLNLLQRRLYLLLEALLEIELVE